MGNIPAPYRPPESYWREVDALDAILFEAAQSRQCAQLGAMAVSACAWWHAAAMPAGIPRAALVYWQGWRSWPGGSDGVVGRVGQMEIIEPKLTYEDSAAFATVYRYVTDRPPLKVTYNFFSGDPQRVYKNPVTSMEEQDLENRLAQTAVGKMQHEIFMQELRRGVGNME